MFGPEKYSKTWEQYSPATLYCGKGLWNFPWCFQGFGDFLGSWRIFVLNTHPETSIFGHLRVKADQLSRSEGYGRANNLSEGQGHIPNMESHVLLKVKVGHLTTLAPDTVSSIVISTLHDATPNLHQPSSGLLYFKIYSKRKRKCAGNQEKQCLQWAQVRKFYLTVKVGYYPWLSLACISV